MLLLYVFVKKGLRMGISDLKVWYAFFLRFFEKIKTVIYDCLNERKRRLFVSEVFYGISVRLSHFWADLMAQV